MADNPLRQMESYGQSLWMDFLRRSMLTSGELQRLIAEDGVTGITSNPSIFEKAIAGSHDYDQSIRIQALAGRNEAEIYEALTVADIRAAADCLRGVYEKTGGGDGFVSLEVSPHLAHDAEGTIAEARHLWAAVSRPNLMIKVPGTPEGLPAIRRLIGEGINVNITLLFGLPRYREVAEAYLAGLEDLAARGKPLDRVASVASFFLSRIDVLLDPDLEKLMAAGGGMGELAAAARGQTAIASAKLAYAIYREVFGPERFRSLAARGARTQRLLWASTSTKNPAYDDVKYVEPLIGPETINTMPMETIIAYRDHGRPADRLGEGLEEARLVLAGLAQLGIDIDRTTRQLEDEGVEKFNQPFDRMLEIIRAAQIAARREPVDQQVFALAGYQEAMRRQIETMQDRRFIGRLWEHDAGLWKEDAEAAKIIRESLGWLRVPEKMSENLEDISRFVSEIKAAGFQRTVLLGMGGSSMAPLVWARTFPVRPGGIPVAILDTTDPATVLGIEREAPVESTLFIVASKSGTTAEPSAQCGYFFAKVEEKKGNRAGENFIAITDPDTPLEHLALRRGFRRVFRNFADIGGRFSGLSYFGLLPAALMGLDIGELLARSLRMANACSERVPDRENPGLALGAMIGGLAVHGRDKATLLMPPAICALGLWLEQLLAESTGKEGRGVLPVAGEQVGSTSVYGDDRWFAVFRVKHSPDPELERRAEDLRQAGFPVVTIVLDDLYDLGQEFFRWEVATAAAGSVLGINAFDQPNVGESKLNTNRLLDSFRETGALPLEKIPSISLGKPVSTAGREAVRRFLEQAAPETYLAIQAFLSETPSIDHALEVIRLRLRDQFRFATTVGYGPRYLHSTGQYHKGGPNTGLFLQLTADEAEDVTIPGTPYTFGVLKEAQALGDMRALIQHGRRVLRIQLGDNPELGLARLSEIVRDLSQESPPRKSATKSKKPVSMKARRPAKPVVKKAARKMKK